jgi:hypothetical protein
LDCLVTIVHEIYHAVVWGRFPLRAGHPHIDSEILWFEGAMKCSYEARFGFLLWPGATVRKLGSENAPCPPDPLVYF